LSTIKLPKDLARDLAWEMEGSSFEDSGHSFKVIVNEQVDSSRWMAICHLVIKMDDQFYDVTYEKGLTEMQDNGPFEDDGDKISFRLVRPQPKTVIEYVPILDGE